MNFPRPASTPIGRFTGIVLAVVMFLCVVLIGFAGYTKYRVDRAESVLAAAPETAINSSQEPFDKLRRTLGYGGFLSLAQNYAASHDTTLLPDMRADIKVADDIIAHLPDRITTETRRDLTSIAATFDAAMAKAEKAATDPVTIFGTSDMQALYAALPILDDRVASASSVSRLAAQSQLQFWAMLLTFVCWASLIIAAAMAVGIYLSLRDRNSTPLRALSQSVKNMAHGDMRTSIWGMERTDMVGELARAVDLARYHFSQLPDMTLLSDQGPVRIRFEGNAKSLFEAMMQLITRDSEQVRQQADMLSKSIILQQQSIEQLTTQVETAVQDVIRHNKAGEQQLHHAVENMAGSAQTLKNANEHAADQLNRIVPFLQERAKGMAEITQITGKQVAQALHSLTLTEHGFRASAAQSEEAIKKLSGTADELGNRLFGAINLLQASGKVLAETTETAKSRFNEAIQSLGGALPTPPEPVIDTALTERVGELIMSLQNAQKQLEETLHEERAKFDRAAEAIGGKLDMIGDRVEKRAQDAFAKAESATAEDQGQMAEITAQMRGMSEKLSALASMQKPDDALDGTMLLTEIRTGFETTVRSLSNMREQLTNMVINVQSQIPVMPAPLPPLPADTHWQDIMAQIDTSRASVAQLVIQQIGRVEDRLTTLGQEIGKEKESEPKPAPEANLQEQADQQAKILAELVATLGALDAHVQEIRSQVSDIKSKAS